MSAAVLAPMPGTIVDILASEGASVEEDQDLLILEAMKMENPIASPAAGKVKSIKVSVGEKVHADQLLMEIE